jgi:hypothetical protein
MAVVENTTLEPWKFVGKWSYSTGQGSGVLVGENHVLTAGHLPFIPNSGDATRQSLPTGFLRALRLCSLSRSLGQTLPQCRGRGVGLLPDANHVHLVPVPHTPHGTEIGVKLRVRPTVISRAHEGILFERREARFRISVEPNAP